MRRPVVVLLIAMFVAVFSGTAAAQDQELVNPLDVLINVFEPPVGMEFVTRLVVAPITGLSTNPDPEGDFEHSTGLDPGYTPDHIDITNTSSFDFDTGPLKNEVFGSTDQNGLWAPTGPFHVESPDYESFHTFTGEEAHDGSQYGDGAVLFGFTLADTPALPLPGRCEYVVWINDISRGPTFINHPSFPGDPAAGTNVAYGLAINPEGQGLSSTFAFEYQEGSGFTNNPQTDVRSFITPNYVGITVPSNQIGEMSGVNFYSFCMEEGTTNFDPAVSGADQTGLISLSNGDFGLVAVEQQVVVSSTTTTMIQTTTTTGTETIAADPAETSDATGFPWWLVLIVGGIGLGIAGWFLFKKTDDPCPELLDAWMTAKQNCKALQTAAESSAKDCERAELKLESLSQDRKDLCEAWPPACWKTKDGDSMEDGHGNRITSWDIHMRKVALGDDWTNYRDGGLTAQEIEAKWQLLDTDDFRNEMNQMHKQYRDLLAEVDRQLEEADELLDDLSDKATDAQRRADDTCFEAEAARLAHYTCVAEAAEASDA